MTSRLRLLPLALAIACRPAHDAPRADDARSARAAALLLDSALAVMGTPEAEPRDGPFVLYASGRLDKAAEGQGFAPEVAAPGAFREAIAVDLARGAIAREYREDRYDGTFEWFREAYASDTSRLYVVHDLALAIPARSTSFGVERRRLFRRVPHLLVAELRRRRASLRRVERDDRAATVLGSLEDGTIVTIELNAGPRTLRRVRYVAELPARGAVDVVWWYDDYRPEPGLGSIPHRYGSSVGGREYLDLTLDSIVRGDGRLFEVPAGFRTIPVRTVPTETPTRALPRLEEVAPGVARVPEVRSGFAPLVVAFDSFVVAIDAPASFPLLGQIPAGETDPGPSMSWASERLVDAIRGAFPSKPIRFLVLTHAHEDHVGGVRAFVAAGATVLGPPAARSVVERVVGLPSDVVADRYAARAVPLEFEAVDRPRSIDDGRQRLELLPVPDNPHAEGMIVAYLPRHRLMFVSDLVTPAPLEVYPRASHASLDRAFATWLSTRVLELEQVIGMHGAGPLTREHLDVLLRPRP